MRVHIVERNNKLGKTPNISTMPIIDCLKGVPCAKDCYARKFLFRPPVLTAWQENSDYQRTDPAGYFEGIFAYLSRKHPKYFRIHVAGDFTSQATLDSWKHVASVFIDTDFLAFTKRCDLEYEDLSANFVVRLSPWPCVWEWERTFMAPDMPRAWMRDPKTPSLIPEGAFECPGKCETCRACWDPSIRHVVIDKHR